MKKGCDMRKPIIAGNWKMNKTIAEAVELVSAMKNELLAVDGIDKVFCPPFLAVPAVAELCKGTELGVGVQDMYWEANGAFTGEVAPGMVKEVASYVIIGHSERRAYFGETDETVNKKIHAAFEYGLTPIVCVGETLEQRQNGETNDWVSGQVEGALKGLSAEQVASLVIAYEPIWAIGTGLAATAEDAEEVCGAVVRATVGKLYCDKTAKAVRVQYGGSMKPSNVSELMAKPNIDGGLIGGASLKAEDFIALITLGAKAKGL